MKRPFNALEAKTEEGGLVGYVEFWNAMGQEVDIVNAARECRGGHYDELSENAMKLLGALLEHEHMSVFEHAIVAYRITCPIFTRTHLFRYRTASVTELSGRIKHDSIDVWIPDEFRNKNEVDAGRKQQLRALYISAIHTSVAAYKTMIDGGVPAEQARAVLPQGMFTTFRYTIDLRNFIHIWNERTANGVQPETKAVVMAMAECARRRFPNIGIMLGWPEPRESKEEE